MYSIFKEISFIATKKKNSNLMETDISTACQVWTIIIEYSHEYKL